jgi:hypothetical protein
LRAITKNQRARESADDVFCDAVGEIVLPPVVAHIGEWKHRDRGAVRNREGRRQRLQSDRRRRTCVLHPTDETNPLAGDGTDQRLPLAAVADRPTGGIDAAGQGGFGDDSPVPDRFDELVLGDDPLAVSHQMDQQIEDLRLDRHKLRTAPELAAIDVQRVAKQESHGTPGNGWAVMDK